MSRQCLACGRNMTEEEWYPEMLCEPCRRHIDMTFYEQERKGASE